MTKGKFRKSLDKSRFVRPSIPDFQWLAYLLSQKAVFFSVRSAGTPHLQRFQGKIKSIYTVCTFGPEAPAVLHQPCKSIAALHPAEHRANRRGLWLSGCQQLYRPFQKVHRADTGRLPPRFWAAAVRAAGFWQYIDFYKSVLKIAR